MMRLGRALVVLSLLVAIRPTPASAVVLCGEQITDVPAYIASLSAPGLPRLSESERYLSVKGAAGKTWTVTKEANPAHPAIICRELKQLNGAVIMKSDASCTKDKTVCEAMIAEFKQLDQQMRQNVEKTKQPDGATAPLKKP
jgi:hypothetical protein